MFDVWRTVGGGESPDTPLAAPSARDSRSAAAAGSHAIPPPPHTGVGPPATAWAGSPHQKGPRAITSPRGALVGCGRIDTLLPHRGSSSRAHPSTATTTITSPGRSRQGVKGGLGASAPLLPLAWASASASVGMLSPPGAAHPTPVAPQLGGARCLPDLWTLPHPGGGGGEGGSPVARSRSRSVRGAAAAPRRLYPLPYLHRPTLAWGPLPPPRRVPPPPPPGGLRAITSPRGALVGCGRRDTLLPGRGSGPWGRPEGRVAGAGTAATTTTTSPGRDR